jgi:hypothetical protein
MQKMVDAEDGRCSFLEKLFAAGCASIWGIGDMIIGMAGLVIG